MRWPVTPERSPMLGRPIGAPRLVSALHSNSLYVCVLGLGIDCFLFCFIYGFF